VVGVIPAPLLLLLLPALGAVAAAGAIARWWRSRPA